MTYHQTTYVTPTQLQSFREKAATQDDLVLAFFENRAHCTWTPSEVQENVLPDAPITSVRRSITNLTKAGKLYKTAATRMGLYGRPEHAWKYCSSDPDQPELFKEAA